MTNSSSTTPGSSHIPQTSGSGWTVPAGEPVHIVTPRSAEPNAIAEVRVSTDAPSAPLIVNQVADTANDTVEAVPETPEEMKESILRTLGEALEKAQDGIYIYPKKLQDPLLFGRFLDRLFKYDSLDRNGNTFFVLKDIDWSAVQQVLYSHELPLDKVPDRIKIASWATEFPEERKSLYRTVTIRKTRDGTADSAQYFFEPLLITVVEPTYDAEKEEMVWVERDVPTSIDFDEFVAHLWRNGVRFGICESAIREGIASKKMGNMIVAEMLVPGESKDATIQEESKEVRRNRAPKQIGAKVDMTQFSVSFPQVRELDKKLFSKVPRVVGAPGRSVTWERVDPEPAADLNLADYAGLGTKVVTLPDPKGGTKEYIVSAKLGFLSIKKDGWDDEDPYDRDSAKKGGNPLAQARWTKSSETTPGYYVTISAELQRNRSISFSRTGDQMNLPAVLVLEGDIEDGRTVTGVGFKVAGNVFAKLLEASSEEGIYINGCVWNGTLSALKGDISIEAVVPELTPDQIKERLEEDKGRKAKGLPPLDRTPYVINNEVILAPNGIVEIYGNVGVGCYIRAKKVIIHGIVNRSCIVTESLEADTITSCEVFARQVQVGSALSKSGKENAIFIEMPDISALQARADELAAAALYLEQTEIPQDVQTAKKLLEPPFPEPMAKSINGVIQTFVSLAPKVRANPKSPSFTPEERTKWNYILPYIDTITSYYKAVLAIREKQGKLAQTKTERDTAFATVESARQSSSCTIGFVSGDTFVRTIRTDAEKRPKMLAAVHEKRNTSPLLALVEGGSAIFHGEIGSFEWSLATGVTS